MSIKLLALDISSRCTGWAFFDDSILKDYGTIEIKYSTCMGARLMEYEQRVSSLMGKYSINEAAIEDIFRGPNILTFKTLSMFRGITYLVCQKLLEKDPACYKVKQIRTALSKRVGKKIIAKEEAFDAIKNLYDLQLSFLKGNDIADAIAVGLQHIEVLNGSIQSSRVKARSLKRGSKKSVSKAGVRKSSRSKSRK